MPSCVSIKASRGKARPVQEMRAIHKLLWIGAVTLSLAGLVGATLAWWFANGANLQFRDLVIPEGFRELVVDTSLTRVDSVVGLQVPGRHGGDRSKRSTSEFCSALFRMPESPAVGNPKSPVQIASFFDYRCPYCRTLSETLSQVQRPDVHIVYKEWPVLGESSLLAARAALAAAKQGQYASFHKRLMNSRFVPTAALVEDFAIELGLSPAQLRVDMKAVEIELEIQRNLALASDLGFVGTPVLVVGRTIVPGPITRTRLEDLIKLEASSKSQAAC